MPAPACVQLEAATVAHVRHPLIEAGLATETEIEEHLANVGSGRIDVTTAPLVSAWGRVPGT